MANPRDPRPVVENNANHDRAQSTGSTLNDASELSGAKSYTWSTDGYVLVTPGSSPGTCLDANAKGNVITLRRYYDIPFDSRIAPHPDATASSVQEESGLVERDDAVTTLLSVTKSRLCASQGSQGSEVSWEDLLRIMKTNPLLSYVHYRDRKGNIEEAEYYNVATIENTSFQKILKSTSGEPPKAIFLRLGTLIYATICKLLEGAKNSGVGELIALDDLDDEIFGCTRAAVAFAKVICNQEGFLIQGLRESSMCPDPAAIDAYYRIVTTGWIRYSGEKDPMILAYQLETEGTHEAIAIDHKAGRWKHSFEYKAVVRLKCYRIARDQLSKTRLPRVFRSKQLPSASNIWKAARVLRS